MLGRILDFVFPRPCEGCGQPADRPGRHVCASCLNRLPFVPVLGCCRCCGRAVEGLEGEYLCEDCARHPPAFDRAGSALRFEGFARRMLLDFKFNAHLWLRDDLTDALEAVARTRFKTDEIELVVPMPLTARHRLDRGYNQCEILAQRLAKRLERPYAAHVLKRVGRPRRQSELNEAERRTNARGTMAVARPKAVPGRTVLVVDDVMTTGATLAEAARVLKDAGAGKVWGVTLARSIRF